MTTARCLNHGRQVGRWSDPEQLFCAECEYGSGTTQTARKALLVDDYQSVWHTVRLLLRRLPDTEQWTASQATAVRWVEVAMAYCWPANRAEKREEILRLLKRYGPTVDRMLKAARARD